MCAKEFNTFISNDLSLTQWPLLITFFDHKSYESFKTRYSFLHYYPPQKQKRKKRKLKKLSYMFLPESVMFRSHTNSSIRKPWQEHLTKSSGKRDIVFHRYCFLANTKKILYYGINTRDLTNIYLMPSSHKKHIEIKERGVLSGIDMIGWACRVTKDQWYVFLIVHKYGRRKKQKRKT